MMGIIGFFVKRTIDEFARKLDVHESRLYEISGDLQKVIGHIDSWNGRERRTR